MSCQIQRFHSNFELYRHSADIHMGMVYFRVASSKLNSRTKNCTHVRDESETKRDATPSEIYLLKISKCLNSSSFQPNQKISERIGNF